MNTRLLQFEHLHPDAGQQFLDKSVRSHEMLCRSGSRLEIRQRLAIDFAVGRHGHLWDQ